MMLNMKLIKEDYVEEYQDKSSSAFQDLQKRIKKEVSMKHPRALADAKNSLN